MPIRSVLSTDGQVLTIAIQGRFDYTADKGFHAAFENKQIHPARFVVDLRESEYLDSYALSMLLDLRFHAGGDHANVRIVNCSTEAKKMFQRSQLDKLFTVE